MNNWTFLWKKDFGAYFLHSEVDGTLWINNCTYILCVPIKRKPGLSLRYLHCRAIFNQLYALLSRAFSLSFDTKHMMMSQCMTEKD